VLIRNLGKVTSNCWELLDAFVKAFRNELDAGAERHARSISNSVGNSRIIKWVLLDFLSQKSA
jgi:hypothetical protein